MAERKEDLMAQLNKINKVLGKARAGAPDDTYLVLDATTGQNAYSQLETFNKATKITGLIITKLDGTAKGGVALGLSHKFQIPICYVGVGEKISDLKAFDPDDYAKYLFG